MTTPNEIEHELNLIRGGQKKAVEKLKKEEDRNYFSNTEAGRRMYRKYVKYYAQRIVEITEEKASPYCKGGITSDNWSACCLQIKEMMKYIEPLEIAWISIKTIADYVHLYKADNPKHHLANQIGNRIQYELEAKFYIALGDEEITNGIRIRSTLPCSNPHYRQRATRHNARKKAKEKNLPVFNTWTNREIMRYGLYFLEVAVEAGLIQKGTVQHKNKKETVIYSDQLLNDLQYWDSKYVNEAYYVHPLIDVPLDWQLLAEPSRLNHTGGYHLPQLRDREPLCSHYHSDSVIGEKGIELVNTLQRTAWRVDSRILQVAKNLTEIRFPIGKMQVCPFDKPVSGGKPKYILDDPIRNAEDNKLRTQLNEEYVRQTDKAFRTREVLRMASQYEYKTFYLTWFVDWRGRYYPRQPWLNIQGTEFDRSLLRFRDGCKLDKDSIEWCKAAIGAAYQGSKISFKDRIKWTNENQQLIQLIAEDPVDWRNAWKDADEPWTFLQLCMEWTDVVIKKKEKFWKVPIGADATASVLQLVSALTRDPEGMKYSNLLEPESDDAAPFDSYSRVLEVAREIAAADVNNRQLIPYLKFRSVGKPVLMTAIYGAGHLNIKAEIKEALSKEKLFPDHQQIKLIYDIVMEASEAVFPSAFKVTRWLKKLADVVKAKGSDCLRWTTPTGDEIHCYDVKYKTDKIETVFLGSTSLLVPGSETPDLAAQKRSFPPSFVHSLDASLLKEAFTDWQYPLAVIHDCIRVLPSEMDRACDRLRDAMQSICSGDPLADLADGMGVSESELKRIKQNEQSLDSIGDAIYMFN